MSAGGRLANRIRMRCLYTGESFRHLKGSPMAIDNKCPIPLATGDQALLESQVMAHLAHGSEWWAHPLGISKVFIDSREATVVHLDGHTELSDGKTFPMDSYAIGHLLPYAEPGVQVNGAPGLRVEAIRGTELHLTRVGGTSRLVLRGTSSTRWRQELADRWQSLDSDGYPPLWRDQILSSFERDDETKYPRVTKRDRDVAWLGSALLRRIALFHTSSSSYSTRSWLADGEWVFELDTRRDVPLDHDTLLARLTDPVWGLPLRINRSYCSCDGPPLPDDRWYTRQCTYHLAHTGGRPGGLQIRFRHYPPAGGTPREKLKRIGANPSWLDRVMPGIPADDSSEAFA
jgi:hypothetical protein